MKKMLQFALISSALLFTFSCSGESVVVDEDPGSALTQTWIVSGISAYDDLGCTETAIFNYGGSIVGRDAVTGMKATTDADCQNFEWFVSATADDDADGADFEADSFCDGTDGLNVSMYLHMNSSDSLDVEAAGNYTKTLYATLENGLRHGKEYTTYGRFFTYGTKMVTQILAKVINDDENGNDRFVKAEEDVDDERTWTYSYGNAGLTMTWMDDTGTDADGAASCVNIYLTPAVENVYQLRGCTDETASNYMGGDSNEFGLTATEETGHCSYSEDEASQPCVKISHEDLDMDGTYSDEELVTFSGVIDCDGTCQYEAAAAWVGDGVCDGTGGLRGDGEYNCEAFNWDGWDCACAPECIAAYVDLTVGVNDDGIDNPTAESIDGGDTDCQIGEENGGAGSGNYSAGNCQAACNVEECGYDIGDLTLVNTWDCCPESCILSLTAGAVTCSEDCNIGACNFYRDAATDIGVCCTPGNGDDGLPIDCALKAGDGNCDEECNTGACNNDGGDCED